MPDPSVDDDDFDPDLLGEPSNDNFRALRQRERKVTKESKAKDVRIAELEAKNAEYETSQRTATVRDAAKAKGLTEEQVGVILTISPNATAEQVEAFAKAFPPPQQSEGEGDEEQVQLTGSERVYDSGAGKEQGFVPSSGGSHIPATPYTDEDFGRALQRGDTAAISRMAAEAAKDPKRLELKWAHLIED